jgi:hypothetical protein
MKAQCVHIKSLCLCRLCVCTLAHMRQIKPMAGHQSHKQGRESAVRNGHA